MATCPLTTNRTPVALWCFDSDVYTHTCCSFSLSLWSIEWRWYSFCSGWFLWFWPIIKAYFFFTFCRQNWWTKLNPRWHPRPTCLILITRINTEKLQFFHVQYLRYALYIPYIHCNFLRMSVEYIIIQYCRVQATNWIILLCKNSIKG